MNDTSIGILFGLLGVLILLSAFFSSSETALMALNRYRLRHRANQGDHGAALAQKLLKKPDRLIGLILLGNNLVNIFAASIATVIGLRLLGEAGILAATLGLTVVVLIFAEVAPKTMAALHPERIAFPASYVLTPLLRVLYPVVWLINLVANTLLRPFGISPSLETSHHLNREELRTLVSEGGRISNDHQRMLINILDLEYATVEDVIVPRHEVVGVDLDQDWQAILQLLNQTVYTRLPVYRDSVDHVVGILHIRTIVAKLASGTLTRAQLEGSVRTPYFIPEGTPLTQQMLEFQARERRMGLVVDEYGDIQGLVTLDDILEEIVGEYTTEARERGRWIRRLDDGSFLVDGSASVRAINRKTDWNLPTAGGRTLGGLLMDQLEHIPEGNASVRIGEHIFTVVDIRDNVIRRVLVKPERVVDEG